MTEMADVPDIAEELADLIESVSTDWRVDFGKEGMRIGPLADYLANSILATYTVMRPIINA